MLIHLILGIFYILVSAKLFKIATRTKVIWIFSIIRGEQKRGGKGGRKRESERKREQLKIPTAKYVHQSLAMNLLI